jgi:predicted homoserine dehydrogenase-like protein
MSRSKECKDDGKNMKTKEGIIDYKVGKSIKSGISELENDRRKKQCGKLMKQRGRSRKLN